MKPSKLKHINNKISLESLCKHIGIETIEQMTDRLMGDDGCYSVAFDYAKREGFSDRKADEMAKEAEQEEFKEYVIKYTKAALKVANKLYEQHGLNLISIRKTSEFRVVPHTSWQDSAEKIRDTINGVGQFYYGSLKEFLAAGPWTSRQATLEHLHWIVERSDVYDGVKAKTLFERVLN